MRTSPSQTSVPPIEDTQKASALTPEEKQSQWTSMIIYEMAYNSAKVNNIIDETVTLEAFQQMNLREILRRLKSKGITEFHIEL